MCEFGSRRVWNWRVSKWVSLDVGEFGRGRDWKCASLDMGEF